MYISIANSIYSSTLQGSGGGFPKALLDEYPGASAAYSLRELSAAMEGSAVVRVRRSNDNTEQDFTSAEITDGTLTTFTGANDGFVTTWYDQSGNSNNVTQATATKQPKLITNGVVELENGKASLTYSGGQALSISSYIQGAISQPVSIFTVANRNSVPNNGYIFDGNSSKNSKCKYYIFLCWNCNANNFPS